MAHISEIKFVYGIDDDSAQLLYALHQCWPTDSFDEVNIGVEAPYDARLCKALGFLGPLHIRQSGGGPRLPNRNERNIAPMVCGSGGPTNRRLVLAALCGWLVDG